MAQFSGSGSIQIKSENGIGENVWSDEHDCVPLKKRLKILLASKCLSDLYDTEPEKETKSTSICRPPIDVDVKKEDQHRDSQGFNPFCFAQKERNERLSPDQSHAGMLREYSCQGTEVNEYVSLIGMEINEANADTVLVEKVDACSSTLPHCSMPSKYPVKADVDYADDNLMSSLGDDVEGSLGTDVQTVKIKTEIANDFVDDLDHVALKSGKGFCYQASLWN